MGADGENRVVLTPPGWRQVVWRCIRLNRACDVSSIRRATVAKVQGSPRRARIRRKPLCRESRMAGSPVVYSCTLCARPRVQSAPGFPCALLFEEGETDGIARAYRAARTRSCGYGHAVFESEPDSHVVIARSTCDEAIQLLLFSLSRKKLDCFVASAFALRATADESLLAMTTECDDTTPLAPTPLSSPGEDRATQ